MRWWWSKREPEKRQGAPLAGQVGDLFFNLAANQAEAGDPSGIAALEAATALYSNAFAAATVTPDRARMALTKPYMALLARNLIRRGEDVHLIQVRGARVVLRPVGFWHVQGPADEETWRYQIYRYGASESDSAIVHGARVVHARYAVHSSRPWLGVSPLQWATRTGTLAAALETRLGEEASGPVGHVIPVPDDDGGEDGDDDAAADRNALLRADIAAAKGRTVLAETTAAGWGGGKGAAPLADYKPQRYGANPPETLPSLRTEAGMSVLSACGVPVSLVTDADGTSQREAWRRFVMGSVEPLLDTIKAEFEAKLDTSLSFNLDKLWAHDLAGRASSFKAMVTAGMAIERAAALSGLLSEAA